MATAQDFTGGNRMVRPAPDWHIKGSNELKVMLFGLMLTGCCFGPFMLI